MSKEKLANYTFKANYTYIEELRKLKKEKKIKSVGDEINKAMRNQLQLLKFNAI